MPFLPPNQQRQSTEGESRTGLIARLYLNQHTANVILLRTGFKNIN